MSDVIQLHNLSKEEILDPLKNLLLQLTEIRNNLQPKEPEEFLTRNEVAELLKINVNTVDRWAKDGKLIRYGMGDRIFYKRHEIVDSIKRLK